GDGIVNQSTEQCDGASSAACPGQCRADCTCPPPPRCGDGIVNQSSEQCDGASSTACPGQCQADCTCRTPAPVAVDLAPVADTYVEAGAQAGWDHGGASHVDAASKPLAYGYLAFDLSGIDGRITGATLTLTCLDGSKDGGTLYRVANPGWPEGDRTGTDASSAGGSGLKWTALDTNRDGKLSTRDTSPWLPDLKHPLAKFGKVVAAQSYTVDVTTAVSGSTRSAFALSSGNKDRVVYASREHPTSPPRLHVVFVPGPRCGDGQLNRAGEQCDGAADAACPGHCRADCTCGTACDGVVCAPPDQCHDA